MDSGLKNYLTPILNWIYATIVLIFLVHKFTELNNWSHWLLRSYLDDLLLAPLVLPVVLVLMRLIFQNKNLKIDTIMLVGFVVLFSITFELMLPQYSEKYTSDPIDIICYIVGTVFFAKYQLK